MIIEPRVIKLKLFHNSIRYINIRRPLTKVNRSANAWSFLVKFYLKSWEPVILMVPISILKPIGYVGMMSLQVKVHSG